MSGGGASRMLWHPWCFFPSGVVSEMCLSLESTVGIQSFMCACMLGCSVTFDSWWPRGPVAHQAPLSMEFSRQEYWSGLPFPTPGDLPHQRSNPCLLCLLHCRQILYHGPPGKPESFLLSLFIFSHRYLEAVEHR